jgi:hypothetical protein
MGNFIVAVFHEESGEPFFQPDPFPLVRELIVDGPYDFFPCGLHKEQHQYKEPCLYDTAFFIGEVLNPVEEKVAAWEKVDYHVEGPDPRGFVLVDAGIVGLQRFYELVYVGIVCPFFKAGGYGIYINGVVFHRMVLFGS